MAKIKDTLICIASGNAEQFLECVKGNYSFILHFLLHCVFFATVKTMLLL